MPICVSSQFDFWANGMHMYVLVNTVCLSEMPLNDKGVCEGGLWPPGKGFADDAGRHEEEKGENRCLSFAHCIFTGNFMKF